MEGLGGRCEVEKEVRGGFVYGYGSGGTMSHVMLHKSRSGWDAFTQGSSARLAILYKRSKFLAGGKAEEERPRNP